jgi:hypothetical protein
MTVQAQAEAMAATKGADIADRRLPASICIGSDSALADTSFASTGWCTRRSARAPNIDRVGRAYRAAGLYQQRRAGRHGVAGLPAPCGATVVRVHGGEALPTVANPSVHVAGQPGTTQPNPYTVAGCTFVPRGEPGGCEDYEPERVRHDRPGIPSYRTWLLKGNGDDQPIR